MSTSDLVNVGSLFTGGGGLDMAMHALFPNARIAWTSEVDKAASQLIAARYLTAPNHGDITSIDWTQVEPVDVLIGGFPCQDISHAGKRAGITKETRSGLWFHFADAIRVLRPRLVLAENVAAITALAGAHDAVLGELADLGFDAEWGVLRASDVGAPHQRARWFLAAWPADDPYSGRGHEALEHDGGGTQAVHGAGVPDESDREPAGAGPERSLSLLPTPAAHEPGGTVEQYHERLRAHDGRTPTFTPLGMLVKQLPTPMAGDAKSARNSTATRHKLPPTGLHAGDTLSDIAYADRWGEYADAIARWEAILGRPAPDPTDAKGRLCPDFVLWMMGWPEDWFDGVELSRANRLKILGNGVVPAQAAEAYRQLLDRATAQEVAA